MHRGPAQPSQPQLATTWSYLCLALSRKECVHQPFSWQSTIPPQTHTVTSGLELWYPHSIAVSAGTLASIAGRSLWFAIANSTLPWPSYAGCPSRSTSCLHVLQALCESCGIRSTASLSGNKSPACCRYTYTRNISTIWSTPICLWCTTTRTPLHGYIWV